MIVESLEKLPALAPWQFFSFELSMPYAKWDATSSYLQKRCKLPDTSPFLCCDVFASVALAWNEEGILIDVAFNKPFEEALYPKFSEGDAVEIFIDTRDRKSAGFATRFCHHFLFLPAPCQGISAQELTRFRTEETHPLCDPGLLKSETTFHKKGYAMRLAIPSECLHGFDPAAFDRMGFTYRLHRLKGAPQYFSADTSHFSLEQHPKFWASFNIVNLSK